MLRTLFFSALCGATLSADTVIGDFGAGTVSGFVTGGYVFAGQTFTVPTPDNVLTTWQIHMQHRDAQNIGFQIFAFTGGAIQFAALYDTLVPLAAEGGVIDLTGLNLPLVSGQTYIAAYHLFSAEPSLAFFDHDVYSGGQATFTVSGLTDLENRLEAFRFFDLSFSATFISSSTTPVPEPSFLPLLTIMMIIAAGSILRRRTISKRS